MTALSDLQASFADRLLLNELLSRHTSARIGGPAEAFLIARTRADLAQAARIAWAHGLPLFILGGGSNILISDRGVRGLVVHNSVEAIRVEGATIHADSGAGTISLARRAAAEGLSGFEWAIGIPGTIGGAAYGNAGAHGGDMAASVARVEAITPGEGGGIVEAAWTNAEMAFEYRSSILKREPAAPSPPARRSAACSGTRPAIMPDA